MWCNGSSQRYKWNVQSCINLTYEAFKICSSYGCINNVFFYAKISWVMQVTMGTSSTETLSVAGNIFVGQVIFCHHSYNAQNYYYYYFFAFICASVYWRISSFNTMLGQSIIALMIITLLIVAHFCHNVEMFWFFSRQRRRCWFVLIWRTWPILRFTLSWLEDLPPLQEVLWVHSSHLGYDNLYFFLL